MRKEYTIILSLVLLFAVFNVVGQAVETAENTSTANGPKAKSVWKSIWDWTKGLITVICTLNTFLSYYLKQY
ncbi:unnamed protein product [Heterobilharzia americana]|nr:unnamed protein product [Heterobilharzia americana]